MQDFPDLPVRVPIGTKYVLEGRGPFVRRYIEYPNGRRIQLATRMALTCTCSELRRISIAPHNNSAVIIAPALLPRIVA